VVPPTTIAATTKVLLGTFAPTAGFSHETQIRVVGTMAGLPLAAGSTGAVGMAVVSDAAVTAGVASMPGPVTDISDDLWTFFRPWAEGAGDAFFYEFDQRGMRKIEEGQQMAVIAESGTVGSVIEMVIRALAKVAVRT